MLAHVKIERYGNAHRTPGLFAHGKGPDLLVVRSLDRQERLGRKSSRCPVLLCGCHRLGFRRGAPSPGRLCLRCFAWCYARRLRQHHGAALEGSCGTTRVRWRRFPEFVHGGFDSGQWKPAREHSPGIGRYMTERVARVTEVVSRFGIMGSRNAGSCRAFGVANRSSMWRGSAWE